MNIDRKQFLLMAAGLSQSLGCMVPPAQQPVQAPAPTQPTTTQPGNVNSVPAQPRNPTKQCANWNAAGQCVDGQAQPRNPTNECTQWNPRSECIAWGNAQVKSPVAEGVANPVAEGVASPAFEGVASPRDECVGWDSNSACTTWNTATPTDECIDWGTSNECVQWRRVR